MFHKHLKSYQVIRQSSPALQTLWFINHLQEKTALMKSVIHAAIWNSHASSSPTRRPDKQGHTVTPQRWGVYVFYTFAGSWPAELTEGAGWLLFKWWMTQHMQLKYQHPKYPCDHTRAIEMQVCSLHMLLMQSKNLSGTLCTTLESITVNLRYWFHISSQLNAPISDIIFLWIVFRCSSIFKFMPSWL